MKEELNLMLANYKLKWVNLVLQKGLSRREVARLSDHSPNTISYWVRNYQLRGLEGLLNKILSSKISSQPVFKRDCRENFRD
jgi:transposase-like protein